MTLDAIKPAERYAASGREIRALHSTTKAR